MGARRKTPTGGACKDHVRQFADGDRGNRAVEIKFTAASRAGSVARLFYIRQLSTRSYALTRENLPRPTHDEPVPEYRDE
jgi:hypothetical protein